MFVHTHAVGIFENIVLKRPVEPGKKDGDEDRNVLETGAVSDHEAPRTRKLHRHPSTWLCSRQERKRPN